MKKNWLFLTGIICIGVLLRLFILSQRGSLWFDEAFSVHFASMDISRMLSYLRFENNPPFYFILLHFWIKLVGSSEIAVRSLSMIFSIVSIPLLYAIGVRLAGKTAALFATFLLAISSLQIIYATETRMYAAYLFLTLAAVWLFVRNRESGIGNRESRVGVIMLSITSYSSFIILLLLVWTHITGGLIVAAFGFYLFWQSQFNVKQFIRRQYSFLVMCGLLALSFAPLVYGFVKMKIASPISQGYIFYLPPDKNYFFTLVESFLAFGQDNAFIVTLLSVMIVGLLWFAIRGRKDPMSPGGLATVPFLFCWLLVPLFVGFAFQNAIPRYFIAVSPALYLLMGIGAANLLARARATLTTKQFYILHSAFYMLVFTLILPSYPTLITIGYHDWNGLARWVKQQSPVNCELSTVNCLVLVNPHSEILPFERYYHGSLPAVGFYPKNDTDDRDTRIVKTNWISLTTKENVRILADMTKGYSRVFLVFGDIGAEIGRTLIPIWFWENGWRRIQEKEFGMMSVMELER